MRFTILNYVTFLMILCIITETQSLTCAEILELPADKKLSITELQAVRPQDVIECLAHLGKEQLPVQEADYIWQTIVNYFNGIENIPDSVLTILHWVTPAVKPEDYGNITLDNIDVVENFGLNYNLNQEQLTAIAERIREDFAGKEPEDYTYYDLIALKQILCQFNRSEVERIHPLAYREAALMIGKLENCGAGAMIGFATLAMNVRAFGPPSKWTENTLKTIGKVAEYLPQGLINRLNTDQNVTKE